MAWPGNKKKETGKKNQGPGGVLLHSVDKSMNQIKDKAIKIFSTSTVQTLCFS